MLTLTRPLLADYTVETHQPVFSNSNYNAMSTSSITQDSFSEPAKFSYKEIFGDIHWSDVKPHEIITNDTTIQTSMEIDNKADAFTMRSEAPPTSESLGLTKTMDGDGGDNDKTIESRSATDTFGKNSKQTEEKTDAALDEINIDFTTNKLKSNNENDKTMTTTIESGANTSDIYQVVKELAGGGHESGAETKDRDKAKSGSKSKKNKKRARTVFVSIKVKRLSNVDSVQQTVKIILIFYVFFL